MGRILPTLCLLLVALAAGSGCAAFHRLSANHKDIDPKQAKREDETLESFESQRDQAQLMAAHARWREGNLRACREALEGLLARNASHVEARLLLVQVLLSEEKFDVARGYLEQLQTERPADARVQHTLGLVLELSGDESGAQTHYRRAAELEPENPEYSLSVRNLDQPSTAAAPTDTAAVQASATADATTAQPPVAAEVEQVLAAAAEALQADDAARARDLLTKAVALDSEPPQAAIRAAVLALRYAHPELAVFVLQPFAQGSNHSAALARTLGAAYYRQGDYARAQSALEQALSLDNTNGLSYLLMGCTLEKLGQSEAAKSNLEQAGRLDPRLRSQR
ncbi:MAG: tetratricopeptide repeat protein [Pirellulales bacterium]